VWALVAVLMDAASGRVRLLPRTRALAFFAHYMGCELVGMLLAAAIWVGTAGGRIGGIARYTDGNMWLQRWWTDSLFHGGFAIFSMRVEAEGLELARLGPYILFVRHSSTADTVLGAALLGNPCRVQLRHVFKRELLWDPCLDVAGHRLRHAFIDRKSRSGKSEIDAIAALARDLGERSGVLIYPEGTRFSAAKRDRAVASLRAKGMNALADIAAKFVAVLPPRLAGPLALIDAAPGVDVVVLEHTGFEGASTFARFWSGELIGRTIRVRVRRIAAATIPATDRDRWLFETWAETDRWVAATAAASPR
jgi:1-acyl-sn-glycerol-3-phosphate acyltransferase